MEPVSFDFPPTWDSSHQVDEGSVDRLHHTEYMSGIQPCLPILRDVYHHPDVVARIKSRRLRWAGHVWRRENSSLIKAVDQNKPEGRRPLGRPRLRWRSQVLKDVAVLGTTPEAAVDREEWRSIVGEAKNLLRFQWPRSQLSSAGAASASLLCKQTNSSNMVYEP
ncbi:uncharacterized protein LOC128993121 [Macrosteles quadrilineatus]|uniref:uncharacterized protein LOC128993121 n=1 Tax=Macrosteles quadrilineatus TaxID=74068 RepID=UPI0023E266D4|nr:uncharacterized protein LOC128993121 [Macrosteles quadrilineatus]